MSVSQQEAQMTTTAGHFESRAMFQAEYHLDLRGHSDYVVNFYYAGSYVGHCVSYHLHRKLSKKREVINIFKKMTEMHLKIFEITLSFVI